MKTITKTPYEKAILSSIKDFMPILQQFQLIADRLDDAVSVLYERGIVIKRRIKPQSRLIKRMKK
jgi:hypothetical protein